MKKQLFNFILVFTIGIFLISSCKDKVSDNFDIEQGSISATEIDSIKNAELSFKPILKTEIIKLDSLTSLEVSLPTNLYFDDDSSSNFKAFLEEYNSEVSESDEQAIQTKYIFDLKSNVLQGQTLGQLLIENSPNASLYQIDDIIKFNEITDIIQRDKNFIIYKEFGKYYVYVRNYNAIESRYYLSIFEIDDVESEKELYNTIFKNLNIANRLFDAETLYDQQISWLDLKPSLSLAELNSLDKNYKSFTKEIKLFLKNDGDFVELETINTFLFKDSNPNLIQEIENLNEPINLDNFAGLFEVKEENQSMYNHASKSQKFLEYLFQKNGGSSIISFKKRISSNSIIFQIERESDYYDKENTFEYFALCSAKTQWGQFYLLSDSNAEGTDLNTIMNDYFVKYLKL
ncbi:hypothetical protein EG240_02570 [Paenimyroides tangerinum]|uniref:Lipoprotein n=1 Tax=Paenimyroides tangerinum TaxID=2488728 RepID=A0A3P3WE90_9FLAO|nr:hypothetical protein [Paenimyroides tangerinum]RRJ92687.1 hypothetical protein EG240_02570 [Paenimyroides tangerinum]